MNRLSIRLSLAFITVTLVTVLIVAVVTGWYASEGFRRYVAHRDSDSTGTAQSWVNDPPPGWNRPEGQPPPHPPGSFRPEDLEFLAALRNALIIAALIAGGTGIALGVFISRTVASPLANLAGAARDFAARHWERRAIVAGVDEVASAARAFNAMADDLQRAETLRRNLMADIAHELRTPLTVIQGNLRALLDGVYPLELDEIASIYDETLLLTRLVSDLRELALAEAGQMPLTVDTVEVTPLLQTAVDNFATAAEMQSVSIALGSAPGAVSVVADGDRLRQILYNLIANALRHAPGGHITLSAQAEGSMVKISVQDTGEGIPPDAIAHIFDRFYRADPSRTRSSGGSGLGLAIAKTWVEMMRGKIGVESTPGKGSTFWFMLPTAAAP